MEGIEDIFSDEENDSVQNRNDSPIQKKEDISDDFLSEKEEQNNKQFNVKKESSYDPLMFNKNQGNSNNNDDLSELSELDNQEEEIKEKKEFKDYDYDSELDDQENNQADRSGKKKKKKNKGGDHGFIDNEEPAPKQDNNQQDILQQFADEQSTKMVNQMIIMQDKDDKAIQKKKPAIYRLKYFQVIDTYLKNELLKEAFIQEGGLDQLYIWLQKCSRSAITLRKKVLQFIIGVNFSDDDSIPQGLLYYCQTQKEEFQQKNNKLNYDQETQRLFIQVIEILARAIKRQ